MATPEVNDLLLTWFVPRAPALLRGLFHDALPQRFAAGETFQTENQDYDRIHWVEKGAVGQAVINHRQLSKPVAMNLYPEGSLLGFINLFTGMRSPRRLTAQAGGAMVLSLPKGVFLERVASSRETLLEAARYSERAAKSELIGMEAIFTLEAGERLALFFASEACLYGKGDGEGFTVVPAVVTRSSLARIVYVSQKTLDRMLAACGQRGDIVRHGSGGWRIRDSFTSPMLRWLREH